MKISNNNKGNRYHDDEGKFTSRSDVGGKNTNINVQSKLEFISDSPVPLKSAKLKAGIDMTGFMQALNDINQVSNIPVLSSARDIEDNVEKYFSKKVINQILSLYGSNSDFDAYQFSAKSNPKLALDIFPNVIGKNRYKNNFATLVNSKEFERIAEFSHEMERIYRGIWQHGDEAKKIRNSYAIRNIEHFDFYAPCNRNCYGSCIYTTVDLSYAKCYANRYAESLIEGLLNTKNAYSMTENELYEIQDSLNTTKIQDRVLEHLKANGVSLQKALDISSSFARGCRKDIGLIGVLLGLDYYVSEKHQRNLLNLGRWIIKEK